MKFKYSKLKKVRKPICTQYKFAELIDVSQEHYVKIENGYNNPSVPVFLRICTAVNKPALYFFTSSEPYLSEKQIETLMGFSEERLKTILLVLKALYESHA